jgi:hypothetical protein
MPHVELPACYSLTSQVSVFAPDVVGTVAVAALTGARGLALATRTFGLTSLGLCESGNQQLRGSDPSPQSLLNKTPAASSPLDAVHVARAVFSPALTTKAPGSQWPILNFAPNLPRLHGTRSCQA